jgi:hypothetical protein
VRPRRLPDDFPSAVALVRDPTAAVQLIVCAEVSFDSHPFATLPVPIVVPSIHERAGDVLRIVDEPSAFARAAAAARRPVGAHAPRLPTYAPRLPTWELNSRANSQQSARAIVRPADQPRSGSSEAMRPMPGHSIARACKLATDRNT